MCWWIAMFDDELGSLKTELPRQVCRSSLEDTTAGGLALQNPYGVLDGRGFSVLVTLRPTNICQPLLRPDAVATPKSIMDPSK